MDILLKNMEMPKSCGVCPIKITNAIKADFSPKNDGSQRVITKLLFTCCILAKDVTQESEKGEVCDDCPLVALPEHGRLVDADAIISKIERMVHPDDLTHTIAYGILKQIIEDAETIVEATE